MNGFGRSVRPMLDSKVELTAPLYGTAAIREIIRLAKESGKYDCLLLGCAPDNRIAEHVYLKLGFRPSGVFEHGENEMRLELN